LRPAITDQGEQLRRSGGLTYYLETRPVQQAGQALSQQDVVVGNDDLDGRHVESFRRRDNRRSLNNLATFVLTVRRLSGVAAG
jgi:hypothetical protein